MVCGSCKSKVANVKELEEHACRSKEWARVSELRRQGQDESAKRLARRLIGVKGPEMPADRKEYLDRYKVEHADEIKARAELKRSVRRRLKQQTAPASGPIRRK